jgi:hypothetical protein
MALEGGLANPKRPKKKKTKKQKTKKQKQKQFRVGPYGCF